MAKKEKTIEEVVEEPEEEILEAHQSPPLNRTMTDKDGNKFYWTLKSGAEEPTKVLID